MHDGLTDIYLVNSAVPNRLLINTGQGRLKMSQTLPVWGMLV